MTTHFRTLLLLGFTGLAASTGCIVETANGPPSATCADNRFFDVQWLVDNGVGTTRLNCTALPNNSVELVLASGVSYEIPGGCDDSLLYNWFGSTQAGVATGDYVTSFRLLRSDTGAEISPGGVFSAPSQQNPGIPSCGRVILTYEFPLMR